MLWVWLAGVGIVMAFAPAVEAQALPSPSAEWVSLRSDGNEIAARRTALVPYRTLDALTAALQHALPARSQAIRLVRTSPPETTEYVVCVSPEGTLLFGEQVLELDPATRRHVLVRHGVSRGYPPLGHGGPWIWLVELPLSREVNVTLVVRATSRGWPVRSVTIDMGQEP